MRTGPTYRDRWAISCRAQEASLGNFSRLGDPTADSTLSKDEPIKWDISPLVLFNSAVRVNPAVLFPRTIPPGHAPTGRNSPALSRQLPTFPPAAAATGSSRPFLRSCDPWGNCCSWGLGTPAAGGVSMKGFLRRKGLPAGAHSCGLPSRTRPRKKRASTTTSRPPQIWGQVCLYTVSEAF